MVERYKRVHRRERALKPHILHWVRLAAVGAMELTGPPFPVDGEGLFVLAVRDLTGGEQLTWVALPNKETRAFVAWLDYLALEFGAPLVLNLDNHGVLPSEKIEAFLGGQAPRHTTPRRSCPRRGSRPMMEASKSGSDP